MQNYIKKHSFATGLTISVIIFLVFSFSTYFINSDPKTNFETYFIYYVGALRIDERWSSTEIIKAREVLHEFYLSAKEVNLQLTQHDLNFVIGQQILLISKINKPSEISKFISLLNFLDFLETIGYIYYTGSLEAKDIQELSGNSIMYFYKIFEAYVLYRREKRPQVLQNV